MGAVSVAVQWVRVGMRNRLIGRGSRIGVVAVTHQVDAAFDSGREDSKVERVRGRCLDCVFGVVRGHRAGPAEIGMRVVDAGIDDGDLDAFAMDSEALPDGRAADQWDAVHVAGFGREQRAHTDDTRQCGQLLELVARDADLDAVVRGLVIGQHRAAHALNVAVQSFLGGPELPLDLVLLTPFELAAQIGLLNGDGVATELKHDRHRLLAHSERSPDR